MTMNKMTFVQGLQLNNKALSPYEISQQVRLAIGCVSRCSWDDDLSVEHLRGYMVRLQIKEDRTPENPEWYECVIAKKQSLAWQHIVWTKEILQIFDKSEERTNSENALREMLEMRHTAKPGQSGDLPSTDADRNGFVLALACAVPFQYREVLRQNRYLDRFPLEDLEKVLGVPKEKIEFLLKPEFEDHFEKALDT